MSRAEASRKRCAIYTRKSSEEGLDQEFNSLAAQREACEAYIRSQQHEGWALIRARYEDGGFSGGNLERPALQRLLAEIRSGRIDIVVVYKVDRLTRSLADFARLVEIFDTEGVSFVSVTQQFNTTSSMGRLTLNVLLSFAQFEREVTGERIRDKIAASKKKGMWMGGNVPLGYDAKERTLIINPAEADIVRRLFALYCALGSVRRVKEEADRLGLRTKCITTADGAARGGKRFSRGHLYRLLANPIYTGQIAHKGQLHRGRHPALIDAATWSGVQDRLAANAGAHRRNTEAAEPSLLAGLLFDGGGERLTPSHAAKKGRRYRYYVSAALITEAGTAGPQGWRLSAIEIESAVIQILLDALANPATLLGHVSTAAMASEQISRMLSRAGRLAVALGRSPGERANTLRELVDRIIISEDVMTIRIRRSALFAGESSSSGSDSGGSTSIELTTAVAFKRRGVVTRLVLPGLGQQNLSSRCDPVLIKAIVRGRAWFEELATGRARSLEELAKRDGISRRYIRRLVNLAFLSPKLVEAILQGPGRTHRDASERTRSAAGLDRAAQTARKLLTRKLGRLCPGYRPAAAWALSLVPTMRDCINAGQRKAARRADLSSPGPLSCPIHLPNRLRNGAGLRMHLRRSLLRKTRCWREMDSNFWYRGTKAADFRSIPGIVGVSARLLNDTT
jgi:site-specific DNA recombinase